MTAALRQRRREPRRIRSARRRQQHHFAAAQAAATPYERYTAAQNALLSAVAHTRPARRGVAAAGRIADELAAHVREAITRAHLPAASAELYHTQLTKFRDASRRLGQTLMCLRGVIGRLDQSEQDKSYSHYATAIANEAATVATEER